jgi:hypothetical protein
MVEFAFQQNAPTPGNVCDISHASLEQEIALEDLPQFTLDSLPMLLGTL